MSRRSLQYRKALKGSSADMLAANISMRHKFAKSTGKTQLYIAGKDRRVPGVPGRGQCSMPIKSEKAARLAATVRRYF